MMQMPPSQIDFSPLQRTNLTELLRGSVVSYSLGYIFIPLGKCANTHIKRMLWSAHQAIGYSVEVPSNYFNVHNYGWSKAAGSDDSPWDHYQKRDFGRLVYDMTAQRHLYKFSVVRNPYSRLLSGYMDKVASGKLTEERLKKLKLPGPADSFEAFARTVCSLPNKDRDLHWANQTYKLAADFFEYDFIGHFEHLDAAKAHIVDALGLSVEDEPAAAVHATGASNLVRETYTDEIAELVYTSFKRDFEFFGYSEDPATLEPIGPQMPTGTLVEAVLPYRTLIARRRGLPDRVAEGKLAWTGKGGKGAKGGKGRKAARTAKPARASDEAEQIPADTAVGE